MDNDPTEERLSVADAARQATAFLQRLEDPAVSESELRTDAATVFEFLDAQVALLQKLAQGYPETLIRADVWTDGVTLAAIGRRLAHTLRLRGFLEMEGSATRVWLRATRQVQGHHFHIVGPAMIAGADCYERLGHYAEAAALYDALIESFAGLIDEAEQGEMSEERWIALDSLRAALDLRQQTVRHQRLRARLKALVLPAAA